MKLKYDCHIQEVADKFVVVGKNRETGAVEQVFNVNETGALILQALQDGKDTEAIVALLLDEYDVEPQEAEAEVNIFLNSLSDSSLIIK